jgi:hypothetical protein
MNERIKELLARPGLERLTDWASIGPVQRAALEEFAQLIVRECLGIVNRHEYSYHEADPLWETAQLIKEHFGVEP